MAKQLPKPIEPIKRSRMLTRLLIFSAILFAITLICILPPHFARESAKTAGDNPAPSAVTQNA